MNIKYITCTRISVGHVSTSTTYWPPTTS